MALPLVLPPTVLGFYLLILLGPAGPIGRFWVQLTDTALTFSFQGLGGGLGDLLLSLCRTAPAELLSRAWAAPPLEAAATLGAKAGDRFFSVAVLALATRGFVTAAVLGFAHTLGEFGVVLMVGGNIPGATRVVSIAIYEHVETLSYGQAHLLSAGLLLFSFAVLLGVYIFNRRLPINRV